MDLSFLNDWIKAGSVEVPTLLLLYYKKIGLSDQELVFVMHVKHALDRGENFPNLKHIGYYMDVELDTIYQIIQNLIENKNLTIETIKTEEGKATDKFSLDLLWEKLFMQLTHQKQDIHEKEQVNEQQKLYQMFEQEFGRPLSPIEVETLMMWLHEDKYAPELIQMALKEAVLAQAYSFKYIDRILLSWDKKNIKTKAEAQAETDRFRQNKVAQEDSAEQVHYDPAPMFNWLDSEEDPSE